MNIKTLKSWAGVVSIVWMVGIYAIGDYPELDVYPDYVFFNALFGIEKSPQLSLIVDLFVWLGVGLLLSIVGLRCWKSAGQISAIVAICVFIYFAWHLLHPAAVVDST